MVGTSSYNGCESSISEEPSSSEMSQQTSSAALNRRSSLQRTSSVDFRHDYNKETLKDLLGLLDAPREWFVTTEHSDDWRRHVCWAKRNGKDLRDHKTQRYSSAMIFMSLLLNAELSMFFGSPTVNTKMRIALDQQTFRTLAFWAGLVLLCAIITTLVGLMALFSAWTMHSAVSPANAHCVFRSSMGLYVSSLPGKLIVSSMYLFFVWLILFFFMLVPFGPLPFALLIGTLTLFINVIAAFSAFGRMILHSGAMAPEPIFDEQFESRLLPHSLQHHLVTKAKANHESGISIKRQYSTPQRPIDRNCTLGEMSSFLASDPAMEAAAAPQQAAAPTKPNGLWQLWRSGGVRQEKKYGHRNNPSEIDDVVMSLAVSQAAAAAKAPPPAGDEMPPDPNL